MKIKICGLTNLEDALAAVEVGADLLGFNFYPGSSRYIEPSRCAQITDALSEQRVVAVLVGVFVNEPAKAIDTVLRECGLHLAQLHGDETPEALERLEGRAYKAIRPRSASEADMAARRFAHLGHSSGPALLVDAFSEGHYGGTGRVGNWEVARRLAGKLPILLAGGLTPDNVRSAIADVRPWGTDVASGVESHPGQKDRKKMGAFVQAVRDFEHELMR